MRLFAGVIALSQGVRISAAFDVDVRKWAGGIVAPLPRRLLRKWMSGGVGGRHADGCSGWRVTAPRLILPLIQGMCYRS
jgi:hypothetical protein